MKLSKLTDRGEGYKYQVNLAPYIRFNGISTFLGYLMQNPSF